MKKMAMLLMAGILCAGSAVGQTWQRVGTANVRAGEYTFTITGQSPTLMRGIGLLDTVNNLFSGELTCDSAVMIWNCGASGTKWGGSDSAVAYNNAFNPTYNLSYRVGVAALPIQNITTIR